MGWALYPTFMTFIYDLDRVFLKQKKKKNPETKRNQKLNNKIKYTHTDMIFYNDAVPQPKQQQQKNKNIQKKINKNKCFLQKR